MIWDILASYTILREENIYSCFYIAAWRSHEREQKCNNLGIGIDDVQLVLMAVSRANECMCVPAWASRVVTNI